MIVVSGSARTGTSMMMQTLILLGYKSPAKKFLPEHKDILDCNPNGFYELYDEVINGIQHDKYEGQVVKMFPGCLYQTDKSLVSKIIICVRDKSETIKSYTPIHDILKQERTPEFIYDANYLILNHYIVDVKHIFINFEDIISNPKDTVLSLCEFLEIQPGLCKINNAIKNIDYASISSRSRNISSNISLRDVSGE